MLKDTILSEVKLLLSGFGHGWPASLQVNASGEPQFSSSAVAGTCSPKIVKNVLWFSFFCKSFLLFLLPGVSGAFPVWAKVLLNHCFSTTWQNSSKIPMAQTHSFRKISEPVFSEALFWCFIKMGTESLLILMFFLNFAYGEWRLESPSIIFNSPCPKLI